MDSNLPTEDRQEIEAFDALLNQMPEFQAYKENLATFLTEKARYADVDCPAYDEQFSRAQAAYCNAMIKLIMALSKLPSANDNKALCATVRSLKFGVQEQINLVTE